MRIMQSQWPLWYVLKSRVSLTHFNTLRTLGQYLLKSSLHSAPQLMQTYIRLGFLWFLGYYLKNINNENSDKICTQRSHAFSQRNEVNKSKILCVCKDIYVTGNVINQALYIIPDNVVSYFYIFIHIFCCITKAAFEKWATSSIVIQRWLHINKR